MGILDFGIGLCKLYSGAKFSQIRIQKSDDNRPYQGKKFPLSVTISCTHFCNLKCSHCQSENSKEDKDISTQRFLNLIDEITKTGCKKVGFTGGEPLMRNDMGKIIKRCLENNLFVSLVSNGAFVPKYIDDLKGIHLLFLSLDGNRKIHDAIRGNGNFDMVIEAATLAKANGIPVAFLTTLSSMNYGCIDEMISIVADNRAHWMVGLIQTEFTGRLEQGLDSDKLKETIKMIKNVRQLRTSKKYLNFLIRGISVNNCFAGIGYCIIDPKGIVYPCFPAQFDKTYKGVSIMDKAFSEAFSQMPLYRNRCQTCVLACHLETNYLYQFCLNSLWNSYKLAERCA